MSAITINTLLDHRSQFLGFVRRRVTDAALAEDILQSAYMRALRQEERELDDESILRWFYRVLRNAVIDHYRSNVSENRALEIWGRALETTVDPTKEVAAEVCACLLNVIDTMQPSYAEILRAVELGEQPLAAFAADHRISAGNATVRVHRARAALRKQLIECCGSCAEAACIDCTCDHDGTQG